MKVIVFGGSGMVGQGVIRECLLDPEIESVLSIGRSASGFTHAKLIELKPGDSFDLTGIEAQMKGYDACFFCLGVSSVGLAEGKYRQITYDLTLYVAQMLAKLNPDSTFIYVSGMGTDSTESGRTMWARVKGRTENALLQLPFQGYMFRPGAIVALHGIKSKTALYRLIYPLMAPFLPWLFRHFPKYVTTTEQIGRAMIYIAREGATSRVIENIDINQILV
jgi:uncharacterized protein YbjT (DUF2867 family)